MPEGFFICPSCQEPIATSEQATHEFAHYLDENPDEAITNTVKVLSDPHTEATQIYEDGQMELDEEYAKELQAEFDAEIEIEEEYEDAQAEETPSNPAEEAPVEEPTHIVTGMRQYITTDESGQPQVHIQRYSYTGGQEQPQIQEETFNMQDLEQGRSQTQTGQEQSGFPVSMFGLRPEREDPLGGLGDMFSMLPRGLHDSNYYSVFSNFRSQGGVDTIEHRGPVFIIRNRMFGPMDYETLLRLDENLYEPGHGADQEEISELPTYTFNPSQHSSEKCSVCLSDLQEGEQVMKLRCFHTFHKDCITDWLVRKAECPICKTPISE